MSRTIYVLTEGEYSDFHYLAAFEHREDAEKACTEKREEEARMYRRWAAEYHQIPKPNPGDELYRTQQLRWWRERADEAESGTRSDYNVEKLELYAAGEEMVEE